MPTKRSKRKARRGEVQHYAMNVTGWDYYYSFGRGDPRVDPGPYSEIAAIDFWGALVRPEGNPYRSATFTLSARTGLLQENRGEPAKVVGTLTRYDDTLSAYAFI